MRTKEILDRIVEAMEPIQSLAGIFGLAAPPYITLAVAGLAVLYDIFKDQDSDKEWTEEEIIAVADKAIAEINARSKRRTRDEVVEDDIPIEESIDTDE